MLTSLSPRSSKILGGAILLVSQLACAQPADPPRYPQPPQVQAPKPDEIDSISWENLSRLLGGPSLLTLRLDEATPQQVVQALNQESLLPFSLFGDDWRNSGKITANYDRQPFWSVIRALEKQGGFLSVFDIYRPGILLRPVGPRPWLPLGQQGPFDFTFRNAEVVKDHGAGSGLRLEFRMLLDPKVRLLDDTIYCRLTQALDEEGHSLLPEMAEDNFSSDHFNVNQSMKSLVLLLRPPAGKGKQVKRVSGELRTLVVTRSESWEIADPLLVRNQEKVLDRGKRRERFLLERVRQEDADYSADLTIAYRKAESPPFYRTAGGREFFLNSEFIGPVRLLDQGGRDISNCAFETDFLGGQDLTLTTVKCVFRRLPNDPSPAGAPAKLRITVPTEWRELVVSFEFLDLPLPK